MTAILKHEWTKFQNQFFTLEMLLKYNWRKIIHTDLREILNLKGVGEWGEKNFLLFSVAKLISADFFLSDLLTHPDDNS